MTTTTEWDYCTIEVQVTDDGRGYTGYSGPGNKLMWFRFIARSSGPDGETIARRGEKTPLANMTGATLAPQAGNVGHQNVLDNLISALEKDGWEPLESSGGEWWQRRLRRPAATKGADPRQWLRWLIPTVVLLAIALTVWQISRERQKPFVGSLDTFTNLPVVDAIDTTTPAQTIGKILPINLDTRELDPIYEMLPAVLRAQNEDDIEALIWIDCEVKSNWRHSTADCLVTTIDYAKREKVAERLIETAEMGPPHTRDAFVLRNEAGILAYLTGLSQSDSR